MSNLHKLIVLPFDEHGVVEIDLQEQLLCLVVTIEWSNASKSIQRHYMLETTKLLKQCIKLISTQIVVCVCVCGGGGGVNRFYLFLV